MDVRLNHTNPLPDGHAHENETVLKGQIRLTPEHELELPLLPFAKAAAPATIVAAPTPPTMITPELVPLPPLLVALTGAGGGQYVSFNVTASNKHPSYFQLL